MTKLDINKILEMTETIAIACGFQCKKDDEEIWVYPVKEDPFCGRYFDPHEDLNDFFYACDILAIENIHFDKNDHEWEVALHSEELQKAGESMIRVEDEDLNKKTAAFKSLHEYAVWKMQFEGEEDAI